MPKLCPRQTVADVVSGQLNISIACWNNGEAYLPVLPVPLKVITIFVWPSRVLTAVTPLTNNDQTKSHKVHSTCPVR
jgi:hypothetical protein